MATDMFLKLADIKGESIDDKHAGETEVLSWSWGMNQTGTTHTGTGGGAGKVSVQDISVTKHVDSGSPALMLACCTGKHFKDGLLTVRKAGEKPLEYLKITMKDIIITGVHTGGTGSDERLTENVTLNFAEFKVEFTPQKPDGSGGPAIEAGYHVAKNVKI